MRRFLTGLSLLIVAIAARPSHAQTISWVSLPADVGSGLQTPAVRARLSTSQHGGVTVRVESAEPALALISADELTPGATFVDIFVPNGSTDAIFYVQAFEDTVGTVHLTATATGFATAADSIDVVTPSQRVQYLNASQDPYDPDDAFQIQVGLANVGNTGLSTLQKVRVGGPGLTATITNSDGGVGQLVTTALTGQVVTVSIAPGDNASPATVAAGGVAFDGLAAGTTDVSASIPGFLPLNIDPLQITVTAPVVSFSSSVNVGAGLQENSMLVRLSGSQHGGTTVHLESTDSTLVLFANGINDAGTSTLDVFFPNGTTNQSFYVQALEGVLGSVTVVGTASGFGLGTTNVNVVQPYFRLNGLLTTIDTLDPNDAFYVSVGIPNAPLTALSLVQEARGGGPGIAFTVTSSNDAVGLLETTSTLDDSALVVINPGQGSSPISVATGGVAFDGISAGVSTVTASATGFLPVSSGIVDVTVTQPTINITNAPAIGLGAGLQTISPMYAQLSASQHGGVIVHVEVADTTLALVAPSATSVGGKFADIPLANGQTLAAFYLQGKENTTGVISLTASAPGFTDELKDVDLVQPVVRITTTLAATHTTLDPPDPFTTQVGVANTLNFYPESVRWGAPSLTVTLSLDDSLIAELLTLPDTSNVVTVAIAPGQNVSPTSVNAGGVAFRGLSAGVVTVTATTPGFISNAKWSEIAVTVTAPAINLSTLSVVGAGLESTARTGSLGTTSHGGVTVHVESLEPELALVSGLESVAGQTGVDIFVPDGTSSFTFYVHGLEDTTGVATIVANAALFTGDTDSVQVMTPGVDVHLLATAIDVADAPDEFVVRVGVPGPLNNALSYVQKRRAGAPPLVATVTSSNGTAAQLVTSSTTNATVPVEIAPGNSQTPATVALGGVALDGLASGQTVVSASIPGFITTGAGQQVVDVTNQNIYINGLTTRLGKDLQSLAASAELGEANHGGTTVHIAVDDTTLARVSANASVMGGEYIDVPLANGDAEAVFYLQALQLGSVTVTATSNAFATAMQTVDIVDAGLSVVMLADTLAITDPDDEFVVQVGAVNLDNSDIVEPQALRGGGPARTITVASSIPTLASIVLGPTLGNSRQFTLDPGEFETPADVPSGGFALSPWHPGTINVTASTPGFVTTTAGNPLVVLTGTPSGIGDGAPLVFQLEQNVPNPFNPVTTIRFSLPSASFAKLVVYDVSGRRVKTLLARPMPAGSVAVNWNGRNDSGNPVTSGVYFYRLEAGTNVQSRKMVLLK